LAAFIRAGGHFCEAGLVELGDGGGEEADAGHGVDDVVVGVVVLVLVGG